jgi:hypothetical protein
MFSFRDLLDFFASAIDTLAFLYKPSLKSRKNVSHYAEKNSTFIQNNQKID